MKLTPAMHSEIASDLAIATTAQSQGDFTAAWAALSRAHIVSQPEVLTHLKVHWRMLKLALLTRDSREMTGQLARLTLAPLGHALSRIPWGNNGRASVSMVAPAPLPDDIARLYADAGIEVSRA